VANEGGFAFSESHLLPQQPHETVALRAGAGIAVTAGGDNDAGSLRRGYSARGLIGETLHQQRMADVEIVVMNGHIGPRTALFRQNAPDLFTLPQIEIERGGQHEYFRRFLSRKDFRQRVAAYGFAWIRGDRGHLHNWFEAEHPRGRLGYGCGLPLRLRPIGFVRLQVGREKKCRSQP
jgi:hypothetical protein